MCNTLVPDATNKLTANDGCYGVDGIGVSNPQPADFDGLLGLNNWTVLEKDESVAANVNYDNGGFKFTSNDGNFNGTWEVAQSILDQYANVAIVMKDGNQNPIPTLVYIVSTTSGNWMTPWVNNQGRPNNSLSNVQLIVNGQIPLPAAGWLMIAGIGGLAALKRRKRAA